MKSRLSILRWGGAALWLAMMSARGAEPPPPVYQAPAPKPVPAPAAGTNAFPTPAAAPNAPPAPAVFPHSAGTATPAPPPSAPPQRSAAELEKLVGPIALYPDPLVATILPASVYPLEIVQAARFVKDTNNLAQLEQQPWDDNVKAVARVPAVIQKMNDDLQWTIALGEAFLAQPKEVMAAIQSLRGKAQQAGTLQTTPQQVVVVTNTVVEKTVEQQVVVVTNTVVQIQPANPQVVYVPQYNPAVVYAPPPAYVYDPLVPLVTFGVGVAVGAAIANNCDWHGGGVYVGPHGAVAWGGGGYHGDVDVDVNRNINRNVNVNQQKWQPDQTRLNSSGAYGSSAAATSREARGWSGGASAQSASASANLGSRPAGGTAAARPATAPSASRPAGGANVSQPRSSAGARSAAGGESAFSGLSSGAGARDYSSRGAASRSGGFSGGSRAGGFSGAGRAGGGRR